MAQPTWKGSSSVPLSCRISGALWQAIEDRRQSTGESVEHIVRTALADYLQVEHGTLFQVSTAGALVEGLYHGEVTIGELREHGDFGLGTFDGLDGEMVVIGGHYYQVRGDGTVKEVGDAVRTPYAMITHFPDETGVALEDCADLAGLQAQLDPLRDSQNVFYALRIDGEFPSVETRTVRPTPEGVPLVAAAAQQQEFHHQHVRGTLVGFWSPGYLQSILVAGYHLHFLSHDRRLGGHLLNCAGQGLRAQVRRLADFRVSLPESAAFLHADLSRNPFGRPRPGRETNPKGERLMPADRSSGADMLVRSLEAEGVEYLFCIPGAKIDKVLDCLIDTKIKTIVCRHEQNAALIAQGIGRMTGKAGVCLVTSGPGCTNLTTGLATANFEGDPVVALGGAVPLVDRLKLAHQSLDTVSLFRPVTKFAAEITAGHGLPEVVAAAFRAAECGRPGRGFRGLAEGRHGGPGEFRAPRACPEASPELSRSCGGRRCGRADQPCATAGALPRHAGQQAGGRRAVFALLSTSPLPVVCTYQGAGVVPRELLSCFAGRVGLTTTSPATACSMRPTSS